MPQPSDHSVAWTVSRRSMAAASGKRREEWLSLFRHDAVVEDPVGVSPLDPNGLGHRGIDAIATFYDSTVAVADSLNFQIRDSLSCGYEVANIGSVITGIGGQIMESEGVFVYRVDDAGRIVSLRAFWEFDRALSTLRPAHD